VRSNRDNTASWARKAFSSKSAKSGLTPKVHCSQLQRVIFVYSDVMLHMMCKTLSRS
jgi:hypothetical protein